VPRYIKFRCLPDDRHRQGAEVMREAMVKELGQLGLGEQNTA
jgi:hypothetical protein